MHECPLVRVRVCGFSREGFFRGGRREFFPLSRRFARRPRRPTPRFFFVVATSLVRTASKSRLVAHTTLSSALRRAAPVPKTQWRQRDRKKPSVFSLRRHTKQWTPPPTTLRPSSTRRPRPRPAGLSAHRPPCPTTTRPGNPSMRTRCLSTSAAWPTRNTPTPWNSWASSPPPPAPSTTSKARRPWPSPPPSRTAPWRRSSAWPSPSACAPPCRAGSSCVWASRLERTLTRPPSTSSWRTRSASRPPWKTQT